MEQNPLAPAEGGDGLQGLQHADLIVGSHHREQQGVGGEGLGEAIEIHQAIGPHRQDGERSALTRQGGEGIEHRAMLRRQGDQAAAALASLPGRLHHAAEGEVVGLRGAAGEDDRLLRHAQGLADLAAGPLDGGGGLQPRPVEAAGGIGEALPPPGLHRLHHRCGTGGGGVMVEIGQHDAMLTNVFTDRDQPRPRARGRTGHPKRELEQWRRRSVGPLLSALLLPAATGMAAAGMAPPGMAAPAAAAPAAAAPEATGAPAANAVIFPREDPDFSNDPSPPEDLVVLAKKTTLKGRWRLGVFGREPDPVQPRVWRLKLWEQMEDRVFVSTDVLNCGTTQPMRITGGSGGVRGVLILRELNPGGPITPANRLDHQIWWAACFPEHTGRDPASLGSEARRLGFSGALVEREQVVPGTRRP